MLLLSRSCSNLSSASSLYPEAPMESHGSPATHIHKHIRTERLSVLFWLRKLNNDPNLKKSPFFASFSDFRECLLPIFTIDLGEIDHRNRHFRSVKREMCIRQKGSVFGKSKTTLFCS